MAQPHDFVFLHGGVQGGWVWDDTIAALARQNRGDVGRTLALDIPGCGAKRGRKTDGLGPDQIADELIADIQAAELDEAILVGHSQAGTILPRLLELRPDLFRRVVYISCIAPRPGSTVLNYRDEESPEARRAASQWPANPRERYASMFCNDMTPEETRTFLGKLDRDAWPEATYTASDWRYDHLGATPASYFLCLRDAVVSPALQETFAPRFRASSLVRLDAGHQVMNTRPHALAEALRHEAGLG